MTAQTVAFESFLATKTEMSAREFGALVSDLAWEDEPETTRFLVYDDCWYIEICEDGRYMLTIENHGWITGPDLDLKDLEKTLFEFSRDDEQDKSAGA